MAVHEQNLIFVRSDCFGEIRATRGCFGSLRPNGRKWSDAGSVVLEMVASMPTLAPQPWVSGLEQANRIVECRQSVYWSRSPPPKADSQIQNRLWGVPSTRIASGSGHSTLNFDRQVSTGPSLCKSQFRLRIKQFECCLDASTKKAGQVSLKAEAQRFNQLPRNALIRDKAFQIDQNYG